jgi:hypothetical protein
LKDFDPATVLGWVAELSEMTDMALAHVEDASAIGREYYAEMEARTKASVASIVDTFDRLSARRRSGRPVLRSVSPLSPG